MTSHSTKVVDISAIALAVLFGVGSLVFFVGRPLGALSLLHPSWSEASVLGWDALLSGVFFLQHSGMNRQPFRTWLSRSVVPRYHGAIYSIASGVALLLVVAAWQTSGTNVVALQGWGRLGAQCATIVAFCIFILSAMSLLTFDPLGLGPITARLRNRTFTPTPLVVRGPYRWVRHPLYSCVIVMLWTVPEVTTDRLLFNVLWTAWIVIGTVLEERDLAREFGDGYREYQQRVPMLVPRFVRPNARSLPAHAAE